MILNFQIISSVLRGIIAPFGLWHGGNFAEATTSMYVGYHHLKTKSEL